MVAVLGNAARQKIEAKAGESDHRKENDYQPAHFFPLASPLAAVTVTKRPARSRPARSCGAAATAFSCWQSSLLSLALLSAARPHLSKDRGPRLSGPEGRRATRCICRRPLAPDVRIQQFTVEPPMSSQAHTRQLPRRRLPAHGVRYPSQDLGGFGRSEEYRCGCPGDDAGPR